MNSGKGKTAQIAFDKVVEQAQWEHGHGGYSGTIAEKYNMVEFPRPKGMRAKTVVDAVHVISRIGYAVCVQDVQARYPKLPIAAMFEVYDSKWGPALAIELAKGEYLFAGWASS